MGSYGPESAGRYISYFHRLGASFLAKEYEKYGIGVGQHQFLIQLYLKDGISHDELTEKVGIDKANTTRSVKKLEETGYVSITPDPKDKRKYKIYLTDKAKKHEKELIDITKRWEKQLTGSLTDEELNTLISLLEKIGRNTPGYFFKSKEKSGDR